MAKSDFDRIDAQAKVIDALRGIISYYQSEMERSLYDDEDLPEELREAERELEKAEEILDKAEE